MDDWRGRAWFQVSDLEACLGGPAAAGDREVVRRRDLWGAIDRFAWPQFKEPQFGQLELATRTEVALLRYMLQSPPMRDLIAPPGGPSPPPRVELPPPPAALNDWRSRALYQVGAFAALLGGLADPEARRRAAIWLAIEHYAWPQLKEAQFGQLELATRTEGELLRYLLQVPPVRERLLGPADATAAAPGGGAMAGEKTASPASAPGAASGVAPGAAVAPAPALAAGAASTARAGSVPGEASVVAPPPPDVDPLGQVAPIEEYKGPPAAFLYKEGAAAWAEYAANEFKQKARAREAARRLREIFILLDKNPDSERQTRALEQVVGLKWAEVVNNVLEKRLR